MFGTEEYPYSAILFSNVDDEYSRGYGQYKEASKTLTKDDILQPYKSDIDFGSSNEDNVIGYNLYLFDIQYQKNLQSAQPIKVKLKFSEKVSAGIYGYALLLTNKLVSISSDGQLHFDLI